MYTKAEVRLEGDVNRNWTLHKSDGSKEGYYSIEGSPQREGDDERVYNYDVKLAEFLDYISYETVPPEFDADAPEVLEYTIDFITNRIYNIRVYDCQGDLIRKVKTQYVYIPKK